MFGFAKYCILFIIALASVTNNGVRGADNCDPNTSGGQQIETYRSGLERLIQGLGGILKVVTGGDDDDNQSSQSSEVPILGTFSAVLDRFKPQIHAIFPGKEQIFQNFLYYSNR